MKRFLILALVPASQLALADTINVKNHGILPGEDATFALNRLIESIDDDEATTLVFPKATYDFHPENALESHRAVTNHDNSLKRIAFHLHDCKNVTIDGGGSTFRFHGRMSPFSVDGSENIKLKNFSIDWSRSFHDEMTVVANNPDTGGFTVEIDPTKYPYSIKHGNLFSDHETWQDRMGSNMVFDPKTRAPIFDTRNYSINFNRPYKAKAAGPNRVEFEGRMSKSPPPVGSVLVTYGTHPTSRMSPAIHLSNSKDVKIEDVTIYEAGGMGVIAERTENVHLDRVTVTSKDDRLVSTRADATHFLGCKGTILVENCLFEHMLDDGINVHGAYIMVVDYLGDNEFLCEISHFQQWGLIFAEAGDKVAILSRETVLPFHETTVTDTRILNEHRVVVTVENVPENLKEGPLSIENLTWNPDLIMRKSIVRENRARSVLVTTKGKVLIEDNYFSSQMHGILIEGDNKFWYESGAVQDVIIRNNEFVNSGFEARENYPLFASPMFTPEQRMGEGHYHRNIRFVNNKLKSFNGLIAFARSVQGLDLSDNTIEFSDDYPSRSEFPSISLDYCDDATINNNTATGFDRKLEIRMSESSSDVEVGENPGFEAAH